MFSALLTTWTRIREEIGWGIKRLCEFYFECCFQETWNLCLIILQKKETSCLHSSQSDGLITDKIDNRPIISTFYMFLFNLQVYATIITLTISSILAPKTLLVLTILLAKRPIMLSRLWWGTQRRSSFLLDHVSLTVFSQERQVCHQHCYVIAMLMCNYMKS